MRLGLLLFAAVGFLTSSETGAHQRILITSEIDPSTVTIDEKHERISFLSVDSIGGSTYHQYDFDDEIWLMQNSDGQITSGTIPEKVVKDYETNGFQLPCFTGPWAALGCAGAAAASYFACEQRAEANIRRARESCGPNQRAEIRSVSGCGNVEAVCRDRRFNGDGGDESGVDP